MNSQMWFLLEETFIPLVVAALIVLGRQRPRRAILFLSVAALILVGVKWVLFAIENAKGAFGTDGYLRYPLEPSLLALDTIRNVVLTFALFLSTAAWILALLDAASERRWGWFAAILAVAVLSYVTAAIDISPEFMRQNAIYDHLMSAHFLAGFAVMGTLAHLIVLVTLIYALAVRAIPTHLPAAT